MASSSATDPATAYLVLKIGSGAQDDGTAITVTGEKLAEYQRVMTVNPSNENQPWTTDDILGSSGIGQIRIGIKNTAVLNGALDGIQYGSMVFACQ